MQEIITKNLDAIIRICKDRKVRRLAVFGSAAGDRFDPLKSDLDLLVEFEAMSPADHAEQFFGLAGDLETVFSRHVDLVEPGPIRNPYFRKSVEETQVELFPAQSIRSLDHGSGDYTKERKKYLKGKTVKQIGKEILETQKSL